MAKQKLQPKTPVAIAAGILLSQNLNKVRRRLRLAAEFADEDIEHVHRLRISTRRSIAALEVFREFLPARRLERIARQLNQIRSVSATARDLDVLIERHESNSSDCQLVKRLKRKRKKAQKPIVESYQRLRCQKQFQQDCRKLLKALDQINTSAQPSFEKWSRQKLSIYVSQFFSQRPADLSDLRELHRFRIVAKKFRYVLEILKKAFPATTFKNVSPQFKRLQDELGHINNRAVALERFIRMAKKGRHVDERVLKRERDCLDASIQRFAEWWTIKTANKVRQQFETISCNSTKRLD